jgi:hypothetical protein
MTTPQEPGDRRPAAANPTPAARTVLDRPPGDRYHRETPTPRQAGLLGAAGPPAAVAIVGVLAFVVLGGILTVTAGLVIVAALIGWITGLLVRPPPRAALAAVAVIVGGLLGIWLFGRWEGGVLDPIEYLAEVQGILVPLELLAAAGLAAAASR